MNCYIKKIKSYLKQINLYVECIKNALFKPVTTITKRIYKKKNKKLSDDTLKNLDIIDFTIVAVVITFAIIKPFFISPYFVIGESMYPTYNNLDYVIVDKFTYNFIREPKRGEVIVLDYPLDHKKTFIKRIIALPNEKVRITSTSTIIYNRDNAEGIVLNENYAKGKTNYGQDIVIQLGDDEYFVMGDNRERSSDSRIFGPVKRDEILGRVLIRLFPFTKIDLFPGYKQVYK